MPKILLPSHVLAIFTFHFLSLLISLHSQSTCSEKFSFMTDGKNFTHCLDLGTLGAYFGWTYHSNTVNQTIDIVFSAKPPSENGWVGWGINSGSRPKMVGTAALIGFKQEDGSYKVMTYNITSGNKLGCPLQQSKIDVEVANPSLKYSVQTGFILYATLILPAKSDYNASKLHHVWQIGSNVVNSVPRMHDNALENFDSIGTLNLYSGKSRGPSHHRRHLRTVHGTLSVIGWGILLPAGGIITRYFREFPFKYQGWFVLHVSCQLTAFLIGTTAWAIGLWLGNTSKDYTFKTHRILGILIFSFSALQMLAFWLKPKRDDKYRKYWDIYHHFLGYGLITAIIFNIFKGFSILRAAEKWKWAYVSILATLGCVCLVFEITTWVTWGKQHKPNILPPTSALPNIPPPSQSKKCPCLPSPCRSSCAFSYGKNTSS